jgi:hypothetical protein
MIFSLLFSFLLFYFLNVPPKNAFPSFIFLSLSPNQKIFP